MRKLSTFFFVFLFIVAFVYAVIEKRTGAAQSVVPHREVRPMQLSTASPSMERHLSPEPFLYAIPLGTFTSYADATLYEWPGAAAPTVGLLTGDKAVEYTSEYRHETEVWLCVRWKVNEEIASWKCTGWVLAETADILLGTIDRSWEYTPDQALDKQAIQPRATKT